MLRLLFALPTGALMYKPITLSAFTENIKAEIRMSLGHRYIGQYLTLLAEKRLV